METYVPTLKKLYLDTIQSNLQKQFGYKSKMQVPRIEKIVINQAIGEAVADKKLIDNAVAEISLIAGQKAVPAGAGKKQMKAGRGRSDPLPLFSGVSWRYSAGTRSSSRSCWPDSR